LKTADNLRYLYDRFLRQESTTEELQGLFKRFGTADETLLRSLIRTQLEREDLPELLPDPAQLDRLYLEITARIQQKKQKKQQYLRALKIAAAMVGALVLLSCYFLLKSTPNRGQEIRLPDGSVAWLDAGTELTYPAHFGGHTRMVILKGGAAFFDVVHKTNQPFIVKTSTAIITVLGTSFAVTAFKDQTTHVSVKTGLVGVNMVNKKTPARFLSPGQAAIVTTTSSVLTAEPLADIAAWREQKLIFNDQPLGEVMESLERKYDVRIVIQNKALLKERITMRLNDQPLKDILTAISFANHFNYEINDQLVVVK
jgi:transmembrane sensor